MYVVYCNYQDFLLPSPWKRVAYVVMLLMVGISCAILALMKVIGEAGWMVSENGGVGFTAIELPKTFVPFHFP